MRIQVVKTGTAKTKKQSMTCDYMVDEPPMAKK